MARCLTTTFIRDAGPAGLVLVALCLCSAAGLRAEEKDDKKRRESFIKLPDDPNMSLEDRQKKVREQMREAQDKAVEKQQDAEKKAREEEKKKREDGDMKIKSPFRVISLDSGKTVYSLDLDKKNRDKDDKGAKQTFRTQEEENSGENFAVFEFPDAGKGKIRSAGKGEAEITAPGGEGIKRVPVNERFEPPPRERGFWEKLFGSKKRGSETPKLETGAVLAPSAVTAQLPGANPEEKTTLLERMQAELAAQRLKEYQAQQARAAAKDPAAADAPASVVDLGDAPTKAAPLGGADILDGAGGRRESPAGRALDFSADPDASAGAAAPALTLATAPRNEAELRRMLETRFTHGLKSRDMLEREWAFRYAAAGHRAEAVPYLVKELKDDGLLRELAAGALATLGEAPPDALDLLRKGLKAKESNFRLAAVSALGRLKDRRAAEPIRRMLGADKDYRVRAACCEAIAGLNDDEGAKLMTAMLKSDDEIEIVRAQCALSLANMGRREGRHHLEKLLGHPRPQMQVMGLVGLSNLKGPDTTAYLMGAMESRFEEVWSTAVTYFPAQGPMRAIPVLRQQLRAFKPYIRRRAALALGYLGSDEGLPYILEAARQGTVLERRMACQLVGMLKRPEHADLLITKLEDSSGEVRKAAAVSLAQLEAKEAVPALMEAARGAKSPQDLPPSLRGSMPDLEELLVLLAAVRQLAGAEDTLVLESLPDVKNNRWPEYDRELFTRQLELIKSYKLVEVLTADGAPVGVVMQDPDGKEALLRPNETVAAGFQLVEIVPGAKLSDEKKLADRVTLARGDTFVRLAVGQPAEVTIGRQTRKDLKLKDTAKR